jgi:hypothetical protein
LRAGTSGSTLAQNASVNVHDPSFSLPVVAIAWFVHGPVRGPGTVMRQLRHLSNFRICSKLRRTHEIGGNRSSKLVVEMAAAMKRDGFKGPPIDVVLDNGEMYVVDGHHRLAAAKMAGLQDVPINVVYDIAAHPSGWNSIAEVVRDAGTVGPNNLRLNGKRLPY